MSKATVNPHQRKVFQEDVDDQDMFEDDSDQDENEAQGQSDIPHPFVRSRLSPKKGQQEQENQQVSSQKPEGPEEDVEYETLQQLIQKLNDEDHSEDEGIEDYKIGGYHPCHIGQVLINRYVLVQKLGWGHFSTVWLAKDFKYGNYVALKIMKSSPHYLEASYDQVEILQKVAQYANHPKWIQALKQYEPNKKVYGRDDTHVLNLLNSFVYKGAYGNHFCMIFQILGVNLLEVLKRYDYKGLPLDMVKEITRQVLMGLDFLNRICRVIHTDLKPENVLLCLTEKQIKTIVEDGQLSSQQLFDDRIKLYRQKYGLGPVQDSQSEEEKDQKKVKKVMSPKSDKQHKQLKDLQSRIEEIRIQLSEQNLNKNQRKTKTRKLKKIQQQAQEIRDRLATQLTQQSGGKKQKQQKSKPKKNLFSAFGTKLIMSKGPKLEKGFQVKVADLGNACWQHHHFATQIQTRQYRGPQVLTGSKYNLSADMWSLACMTFEMLTGQLLFNPRKDGNQNFGKNDDHIAQMMELLGRFPKKMTSRGVKGRKYFSKEGNLNRIPKLQNWSLKDVMIAKYRFTEEQAQFFEDFMTPMLNCYPQRRTLSDKMLKHPWLYTKSPQNYYMSQQEHRKIKAQKYDLQGDVQKDEVYQYESQNEDGDTEDNLAADDEDEDEFYEYEKVGDIRYIDRSYMDLGYIGYGDGIYLEKLDFGPNWQFQA